MLSNHQVLVGKILVGYWWSEGDHMVCMDCIRMKGGECTMIACTPVS